MEGHEFYDELYKLDGVADLFCMVDSFGGVSPHDVKETIDIIRNAVNCPIGFHGHNNLEMGLVNTIAAIEKNAILLMQPYWEWEEGQEI